MNAWALLYDELYGDDKMTDNRVTPQESDEYDPKPKSDKEDTDWDDPIIGAPSPLYDTFTMSDANINIGLSTDSIGSGWADTVDYESITIDTSNFDYSVNLDQDYMADTWPHATEVLHTQSSPTPGIEKDCPRKYKEDEAIKALQDYISTTYGGHYTSKENNVQTLDLIESVGDAESFCRSNAIKYLSRYDKKGQAKRDILKALHYSLLLYHFSGQLNETPTRGYETF